MIKKIELKNFQSHVNSKLEFIPGINIISGISNNGKSAIIKALNWVINGEPSGNDIINYNADECNVTIQINDNEISKIKSDKKNQYIINKKELNSVGQSIPEEVNKIFNFSELNMRMQFDKFFLLQDSPGEVARKLNKIINLEIIDASIKKAKNKVNEKKKNIDNLEEEIILLKDKIKKFDFLDEVKEKIKQLDILNNQKNNLNLEIIALELLKKDIENNLKELNKYNNIPDRKIIFKKLKDNSIEYEKINNSLNNLLSFKEEYLNNKAQLKECLHIEAKKKIVIDLKKDLTEYEKINNFLNLLLEFKENNIIINDLKNKVYNIEQLKAQLLPKGSVCPICKKII